MKLPLRSWQTPWGGGSPCSTGIISWVPTIQELKVTRDPAQVILSFGGALASPLSEVFGPAATLWDPELTTAGAGWEGDSECTGPQKGDRRLT